MEIREITLEQLLAQSEPATHSGIVNLWKSSDVHFLVVFSDTHEQRRGLVAVGPSHDFKSLEDLKGADFDGLRPAYMVAAQNTTRRRQQRPAFPTRGKLPEAGPVTLPELDSDEASSESASAAKKLRQSAEIEASIESSPTLQTLQQHLEEQFAKVQKQLADIEQRKTDLAERERWVTDAEDRLNRLTEQFMERDASLQKRELALQKKEKDFYALRFDTVSRDGKAAALLMASA
ncbi:MAG: hypothetical protein SFY80_14290 [Verrucomicrobiota bacterium]|nr:hypothetical protein [Verrucomicrobiota bacterium]